MKHWHFLTFVAAAGLAMASSFSAHAEETRRFDADWKFFMGYSDLRGAINWSSANAVSGPSAWDFPDGDWTPVDLPHDWVLGLPLDQEKGHPHQGYKAIGWNFGQNNIGWYRKTFDLPAADRGKRVSLVFDGVFSDSIAWMNNYLLGRHPSGYTSFRYDITPLISWDRPNTVALRVDASQFALWSYEGGGIYRHVWLVVSDPVAIEPDHSFITTALPHGAGGPASIHVSSTLGNHRDLPVHANVLARVLDARGNVVASGDVPNVAAGPWGTQDFNLDLAVNTPALWSPETPNLYHLDFRVREGSRVADETQIEFGIRTATFDKDRGFILNGKPYVIKGTCNHEDSSGVGTAVPDDMQYDRIHQLKAMGCNGYRTTHGPPNPQTLIACDRLGLLVLEETRTPGVGVDALENLRDMVLRDRNHPSVIAWSLGNEEEHAQRNGLGASVVSVMLRTLYPLDPTRGVTYASSAGEDPGGISTVIPVRGWNYHAKDDGKEMDDYRATHPNQPELGTEQGSVRATRGIYADDKDIGYVAAYYNLKDDGWWKVFAERPWMSGAFTWSGFDYRGEPSPHDWPCVNSNFGLLDLCGFPKDIAWYFKAWWAPQPMVHVLPHWNWSAGKSIRVQCFANTQEVELFLNGRSLGRKPMPPYGDADWQVSYAPGRLQAVGYRDGAAVASDAVETTGAPAALKLQPHWPSLRANGRDVAVVDVAAVDAQGRVVPDANLPVSFTLSGPGKMLGADNGDPASHEPEAFAPVMQRDEPVPITGWQLKTLPKLAYEMTWKYNWQLVDPPAELAGWASPSVDAEGWTTANIDGDEGTLPRDACGAYRAAFNVNAASMAGSHYLLEIGSYTHEVALFLNGRYLWTQWSESNSGKNVHVDITHFLRGGENNIVIAVSTGSSSPGGLFHGIRLVRERLNGAVAGQHSTFNGRAQVIVQAGNDPGTLRVTASSPGLQPASLALPAVVPPAAGSDDVAPGVRNARSLSFR